MTTKSKEPIRLRQKKLKGGNKSLYLDFYHDGNRYYEYLRLYLIPERTRLDKERNRATLVQAEAAKARRIIEYQQGIYGIVQNSAFNKVRISEYIDKFVEKNRSRNPKLYAQYAIIARRIRDYDDAALTAVNVKWIRGFIEHLGTIRNYKTKTTLSENTINLYLDKLGTILKKAMHEGLISNNPMMRLTKSERPKGRHAEICYLTIDEVRLMSSAPCQNELVRMAFLFSCFTGLRFSDVSSLRWCDVADGKITKTMVKTNDVVTIPVSRNAEAYMPARNDAGADSLVFDGLPTLCNCNSIMKKLANVAGINKHVTFHVARHTAATLWLTYGADLYVVSKLLGHKSIASTQIYAKVVDARKKNAVELIPAL